MMLLKSTSCDIYLRVAETAAICIHLCLYMYFHLICKLEKRKQKRRAPIYCFPPHTSAMAGLGQV